MLHAGRVEEVADNGAFGVDVVPIRRRGGGEVKLGKCAALVQECVSVSGGIVKAAHNLGAGIHAKAEGEDGSRRIDGGEDISRLEKAMLSSGRIHKGAHELAAIVEADNLRTD